jgi:hypothetical protein
VRRFAAAQQLPQQTVMTFAARIIGALALDASTYDDVEADGTSIGQAVAVAVLSAIATAIGARGFGAPIAGLPTIAIGAFLAWGAWAILIYEIGVRIVPGRDTHADLAEVLRTMGFASAPGLLRVFGIVPAVAAPIFVMTGVWMLLAMLVAIRQALDYTSTARAVVVCALGWALTLVVVVVLGLLASPALSQQIRQAL